MVNLFIGIDWGSKTHTVCVVNAEGRKVWQGEVAHHGEAVLAFVDRLTKLTGGDFSRAAAAMESPHGVMVEALLERGLKTYSINPKQLDRFRDRHSVAGAKDDDLDAFVLATSLRTDMVLYREIELPGEQLMQLKALSRSYDTLTDQVVALGHQVHEQLVRYYPQMAELGEWHRESWLWELLEAAPTPAQTAAPTRTQPKGLSEQKVAALLKKHGIRRHEPAAVLASLRSTPLPVAAGVAEACAIRIQALLPVLRVANEQRNDCTKRMKTLLSSFQKESDSPEESHHDAALILSLPGIGVHNGAVMLTEAFSALRDRDYQGLWRGAGVAPVSQRTGGKNKKPHVLQRRACSGTLRDAVYHWARIAVQREPRSKQHYADLRARGHSHGRAIRGVADRLLAVLIAVLKSGRPYDPARRAAQKNLQTAA